VTANIAKGDVRRHGEVYFALFGNPKSMNRSEFQPAMWAIEENCRLPGNVHLADSALVDPHGTHGGPQGYGARIPTNASRPTRRKPRRRRGQKLSFAVARFERRHCRQKGRCSRKFIENRQYQLQAGFLFFLLYLSSRKTPRNEVLAVDLPLAAVL